MAQPVWTGNVVLTGNTTINSGGTQIYSTGQSDSGLTISGSISDLSAGADYTLSKIGAGVLTLAGADTYGGLTQIEQGAIQTQNAAALSGSSTVVDNGTALELDSNLNAEPITLNGNGFEFSGHYAGSLWNIDGNNTLAGVITMNTNATIGVAAGSSLTVTGSLVDPGATSAYNLTKELTGTLELASADNYHGTTTVNQGALRWAMPRPSGPVRSPCSINPSCSSSAASPWPGPPPISRAAASVALVAP